MQELLFPAVDGLSYCPEFVDSDEAGRLVEELRRLELAEFRMHGVAARRRVAHYGYGYAYGSRQVLAAPPMPEFLLPLRERVAAWSGCRGTDLVEVLVNWYPPGAGIGWHVDAPGFGHPVIGLSLLNPCRMLLRPGAGPPREVCQQTLAPRSVYALTGPARYHWQHRIPPVRDERFSITFRTVRNSLTSTAVE